MLAAVDVHYRDPVAAAACVVFESWGDSAPRSEHIATIDPVADYESGEFWKRELPCLVRVLARVDPAPSVVVVDGHVWLDDNGRKGLGAHLYDALGEKIAIIGVAKRSFHGLTGHQEVCRGDSESPLFVTSVGFEGDAGARISQMHGAYRMPTLLKRVDQLCRNGVQESP